MRYLHGRLHLEQDSTRYLKPCSQEQKLTCMEYLPIVILGILLTGLLLLVVFG